MIGSYNITNTDPRSLLQYLTNNIPHRLGLRLFRFESFPTFCEIRKKLCRDHYSQACKYRCPAGWNIEGTERDGGEYAPF